MTQPSKLIRHELRCTTMDEAVEWVNHHFLADHVVQMTGELTRMGEHSVFVLLRIPEYAKLLDILAKAEQIRAGERERAARLKRWADAGLDVSGPYGEIEH